MALTYDETLPTDRDKLRFWLQDTEEGKGPKPEEKNFSDEELDALLAGEDSWQEAVAAGFEVLASAWTRFVNYGAPTQVNRSLSDVAPGYREQADRWRARYGRTAARAVQSGPVPVAVQAAYTPVTAEELWRG